ncbi:hypothetical protein CE665_00690 [Salmonella enterica subsp. enterica serovar Poona]|nr:hypothetical protein [Salmonella enterica subsp. enterica serovar Poona]
MKLTVGDIRFSESGYAFATVEVETGTFPFLLFSICKMDVSVPVVDGKAIKDYGEDLKNKAREIITRVYKEIVCGGEPGEASGPLNHLSAKTEPSEFSCKVKLAISDDATNKDLEERVALLEKRLSGKKTVHASEKVVEFYNHDGTLAVRMGDLNQAEKRLTEEVRDDNEFRRIYDIAKIAAKDIISPAKSDFQ